MHDWEALNWGLIDSFHEVGSWGLNDFFLE